MSPTGTRRPLIARPDLGEHPLDELTARLQTSPPELAPTPAVVPAPVAVDEPDPAPTPSDDAPRLRSGRRSLAGRATTVTFLSADEYDRVQHAYAARGLREGYPSQNDWMCSVILRAVEDLEERFNDGNQFTKADAHRRRR